jgi:hypothetical protein
MRKNGKIIVLLAMVTAILAEPRPIASASVDAYMKQYRWEKRPILLFVPDTNDPNYRAMRARLRERKSDVSERHMVTLVLSNHVEIDGKIHADLKAADFYRHYKISRTSFRVLLIGKDGGVKLNEQGLADPARIFALIDTMPMRRAEMREPR